MTEKIICPNCQSEFLPYPYQLDKVKRGEMVYCSVKCKRIYNYQAYCSECGKQFLMDYNQKRSLEDPDYKLYCSKKCKSKGLHTDFCDTCGERFKLSYDQKTCRRVDPNFKLFCSIACQQESDPTARHITIRNRSYNIAEYVEKLRLRFPHSTVSNHLEDIIKEHSEGVTLKDIGLKYGVSKERIRQILNKFGVDTSIKKQIRLCGHCGKEFDIKDKKYCSDECRDAQRRIKRRQTNGPPTSELYNMYVCGWCNSMFIRTLYLDRIIQFGLNKKTKTTDHKKFCNRKCYSEYLKTAPYGDVTKVRKK